jgi:hypothetical protein
MATQERAQDLEEEMHLWTLWRITSSRMRLPVSRRIMLCLCLHARKEM